MKIAIMMKSVIVFPITFETFLESLAPTACPISTVPPIARPTIITVNMCITWLPIETAEITFAPLN